MTSNRYEPTDVGDFSLYQYSLKVFKSPNDDLLLLTSGYTLYDSIKYPELRDLVKMIFKFYE